MSIEQHQAALPADLKIQNRRQVLRSFRAGEVLTVNDIALQTGISRQTAMKAVRFFVDKGILAAVGRGRSTSIGGKRPDMFRLQCERYLIAISLWPNMISFSLLNLQGEILERAATERPLPHTWEEAVDKIEEFSQIVLKTRKIEQGAIYGVAVSTAGIVDYKTGVLKYSSISPEWGTDIPLGQSMRALFGEDVTVLVENSGKMVARALLQDDALRSRRVLSVFSTWGISACMIDQGKILNGPDSLIGEIGHMTIDPLDRVRCGCGSYGCLEQLVGQTRMIETAKSLLPQYPDSALHTISRQALRLQDIFSASDRQDPLACAVVERSAGYFAIALRNVILTFDPETIVFQGIYAQASEYFDRELRKKLDECRYLQNASVSIVYDRRPLAELNLQGAVRSLQDAFFEDAALYLDAAPWTPAASERPTNEAAEN